jgi:hypothetical protein
MIKQPLDISRLEYFDRQKALYDRVKPELVDRYLEDVWKYGEYKIFKQVYVA